MAGGRYRLRFLMSCSEVGLQWGGKHILEQVRCSYTEMRVMQAESECGDGANTWEHMEYIFGL